MQEFLLFLHIAAAIIIIGGLAFMDMVIPGMVRGGTENLPVLRKLHKLAAVFGPSSIVVFLTGVALVLRDGDDRIELSDSWVGISMLLFIVAAVLGGAVGSRVLGTAIGRIESGEGADAEAGRLSMIGGIDTLILLTVVYLMVAKPGLS